MAVTRTLFGSWKLARGRLCDLALTGSIICTSFSRPTSLGLTCASHKPVLRSCTCIGHSTRSLHSTTSHKGREIDGRVSISITDRDGDCQIVRARLGDNLLEVAREYDIDLEGACDGTLSCSTCHLVVDPEWFPRVTDPLTEEEEDMLDLAYGLTDTSRLGCQVVVTEDLDGLKLTIPMATIDARET